jgi:hypothetical protein
MTNSSKHLTALSHVLSNPRGGIVGVVDDLLELCREHHLRLEWRAERYRVRSVDGPWEELQYIRVRKPIFRDLLARLAVLCNNRIPNSVSLYGGTGELSVGANPPTVFRVNIANKADQQHFELVPIQVFTTPKSEAKIPSKSGSQQSIFRALALATIEKYMASDT